MNRSKSPTAETAQVAQSASRPAGREAAAGGAWPGLAQGHGNRALGALLAQHGGRLSTPGMREEREADQLAQRWRSGDPGAPRPVAVRVHDDAMAGALARGMGAAAFTLGTDIFMARRLGGASGARLFAHEVAHATLHGGQPMIWRQVEGARPDDYLEQSRAALARIHRLLETGLFVHGALADFSISAAEAHTALEELQRLARTAPAAFLHARLLMHISGDWRRMAENLSEADRMALGELDMQADPNAGFLMQADAIRLQIYAGGELQPELSQDYDVARDGVHLPYLAQPVRLVGLLPQAAATLVARTYHEQRIFFEPRVRLLVSRRGAAYSPAIGATAQTLWFDSDVVSSDRAGAARRAQQSVFLSYIRAASGDDPLTVSARGHYLHWIEEHRNAAEFLTRSPADLWRWALQQASAPAPESPARPFLDLMRTQLARMQAAEGEERTRLQGALTRYTAWLDDHLGRGDLARHDPARVWVSMYMQAFERSMARMRDDYLRAAAGPIAETPEAAQARLAKFNEFMRMAMQLWGYSGRTYPYLIPVPSEGRDWLVSGDPAHQRVLNRMAAALMSWATDHMYDADFLRASPTVVLADRIMPQFQQDWNAAATAPLQAEVIDRNELVPARVLAAFGQTVATGLLVIAACGAAVGLGVPLAAVLAVLGAVAAVVGVVAYLARREEVERAHLDVPVSSSVAASLGDIVGLSQFIEGITGERLDSGRRLESLERSEQMGTGAGSVALVLVGSRTFRAGQLRGQQLRLARPGAVPLTSTTGVARAYRPGPLATEARAALPEDLRAGFDAWLERLHSSGGNPENDLARMPEADRAARVLRRAREETQQLGVLRRWHAREGAAPGTARPGGAVQNARARLPQELRVGFDEWIDAMREAGRDEAQIESIVRGMTEPAIRSVAENNTALVQRTLAAELARRRLATNPLRPLTRVVETRGRVTLRYNARSLAEAFQAFEVEHAELIAQRTGEPVTLFGDSYAGIDGTIGEPPRPLSLKFCPAAQSPNYARFLAESAYQSALSHGYSHVEVHIRVPGSSVAEVQAQWNGVAGRSDLAGHGTLFDGADTIARYVLNCGPTDLPWVVGPPTGPAVPAAPVLPRRRSAAGEAPVAPAASPP